MHLYSSVSSLLNDFTYSKNPLPTQHNNNEA